MIIYEETVNRSKKKIDTIRSGLDTLDFGKYLSLSFTKDLFVGEKKPVKKQDVTEIIEWPSLSRLSERESTGISWLREFINQAKEDVLSRFLKFASGSDVCSLHHQHAPVHLSSR